MESNAREVTTLAGGCFWCIEAVFLELNGVTTVESGYTGGEVPNPTYDAVCSGATGHAEVVQVTFDPAVVSFEEVLHVFFSVHDPTTLNQQGPDVGTQYRSAVYYHNDEQREVAERVIAEVGAEGVWNNPIVTEVTPLEEYYPAEAYHQEYYRRNPEQFYCQIVIAPKMEKFRQKYGERVRG